MSAPRGSTLLTGLNDTGQGGTAGKAGVCKIVLTNTSGAVAWVQFFDLAIGSVVLGTTVPLLSIPLPVTVGYLDIDFFPFWVVQTRLSIFSTTTQTGLTGSAAGVSAQVFIE